MVTETYNDLIGIVVGNILADAPPLAFYLHSRPGRRYHVRIEQGVQYATTRECLNTLARIFEPCVQRVLQNSATPPWFFIQLKELYHPNTLKCFGLPWTVYQLWHYKDETE